MNRVKGSDHRVFIIDVVFGFLNMTDGAELGSLVCAGAIEIACREMKLIP